MKVNIYLPHSFKVNYKADVIVGVDYGAFILAQKGIRMDVAIGDFDSTSNSEFELVEKFSDKVIKLKVEKNETDSEAAIMYLQALGYKDITIVGDIGNRLDHFLINYRLIEKYNVTYLLNDSKIFSLEKGVHKVKNEYQFLSLFTNDRCSLNLSGTKYKLKNATINYFDTYTSANEIIDDNATIEIISGKVTVVLSSDK